jgi:hypothetical protein
MPPLPRPAELAATFDALNTPAALAPDAPNKSPLADAANKAPATEIVPAPVAPNAELAPASDAPNKAPVPDPLND